MQAVYSKQKVQGAWAKLLAWLERHGIWLVLAIAGVCYALSFNPRLSGTDMAVYLVTAKALAAGEGFCKANLAGCPPEVYYPPGFPLILAPFVALLPEWPQNIPWLTLVPMACALLSLPLIHRLLKRELDAFPLPLLITLAVAVSYVGTWFTFTLMSETLYILVSVAALLALDQAEAAEKPQRHYLLAGLLAGFLALVRSVGLALLAGAVGYLLLRRKWKEAAIVLVPAAVLVVPVLARSYLVTHSPAWEPYRGVFIVTYLDTLLYKHWQDTALGPATLADLARRWPTNIEGHATVSLPMLLFPTVQSPRLQNLLEPLGLTWAIPAFKGCAAGMVLAGFALRLRRPRPLDLYVLLYVGIILLPGWYTYRNLVPIQAFLYLYAVVFLRALGGAVARASRRPQVAGRLGLILPVLFLFFSTSSNLLSMVGTNVEGGARYQASGFPYVEDASFFEACAWVRQHTGPEDLVVSRSSEKMYLCSGRRAPPSLSTMPLSLNGREHAAVVEAVYREADFVVIKSDDVVDPPLTDSEPVDFETMYFLQPVLERDARSFALRYETGQQPAIRIYQVLR
jgi:hypothetical protein